MCTRSDDPFFYDRLFDSVFSASEIRTQYSSTYFLHQLFLDRPRFVRLDYSWCTTRNEFNEYIRQWGEYLPLANDAFWRCLEDQIDPRPDQEAHVQCVLDRLDQGTWNETNAIFDRFAEIGDHETYCTCETDSD